MKENSLLVVAGIPRSGTTWLAEIVAEVARAKLIHEPDNELSHPLGFAHKKDVHRFPSPEDVERAPDVMRLFHKAAYGWSGNPVTQLIRMLLGRKYRWHLEEWVAKKSGQSDYYTPDGYKKLFFNPTQTSFFNFVCATCMPTIHFLPVRPRVIKTVHAPRILTSVATALDVDPIVIIRNPFAIVASLNRSMRVGSWHKTVVNADRIRCLPEGVDVSYGDDDVMVARQVVYLISCLRDSITDNEDWRIVSHDACCRDLRSGLTPLGSYPALDLDKLIVAAESRIGKGSGFDTARLNMEDQIDKWKKELSNKQIDCVNDAISEFQLESFLQQHGATGLRYV